jgi:hypothetical protein
VAVVNISESDYASLLEAAAALDEISDVLAEIRRWRRERGGRAK